MWEPENKKRLDKLIALRAKLGVINERIVEGTGIDPGTISRAMRGGFCSHNTLMKIDQFLRTVTK